MSGNAQQKNRDQLDATERPEHNAARSLSTEETTAADCRGVFDDGSGLSDPIATVITSKRDNDPNRSRSNSSELSIDTHKLGPTTTANVFDKTVHAAFEVIPDRDGREENPSFSTIYTLDPVPDVPFVVDDSMVAAAALRQQREIETRQQFAATSTPVGAVRVEYHRNDGDPPATRLQDNASTSSSSLQVVAYLAEDENPHEIQTDDSDNSEIERPLYPWARTRITVAVLLITVVVGGLIGGICGAGLCHPSI